MKPMEMKSLFDLLGSADGLARLAGVSPKPGVQSGPSVDEIAAAHARAVSKALREGSPVRVPGARAAADQPVPVPAQFRVGDVVRVVKDNCRGMYDGDVGEILGVSKDCGYVDARIVESAKAAHVGRCTWFWSVDLAFVEHPVAQPETAPPKQKPELPLLDVKVGDRVRVVQDKGRDLYVGHEGIVVGASRHGATVNLDIPGSTPKRLPFILSDLALLARGPEQPVTFAGVGEREAPVEVARRPAEPLATWAATLELAGGRLVDIPAPSEADWDLAGEQRFEAAEDVRVQLCISMVVPWNVELRYLMPAGGDGGVRLLGHDAARCWAHDMARVVNEQGPLVPGVAERGALLRSLRTYRRRPPVDPHAALPFPTLRAFLW